MKRALLLTLALSGAASAQDAHLKGDITVWSWNVAADALKSVVPAFNRQYPNVKVSVVDPGHDAVFNRGLSGCAAGGSDLPDVYTVENQVAEMFWSRFPDCFTDLSTLGADKLVNDFAPFKWTELTVGDKRYAMPWDTGPVVVFYRRDLYKQAGIDPSKIQTWDDFIAAGKQMNAKLGGKVKLATTGAGLDDDWFRSLAIQNGCNFFSASGPIEITVNKPGCVQALDVIKRMYDSGIAAQADWNAAITQFKAGKVASFLYGGWYEGIVRSNAPDQKGLWGVYPMPAFGKGGVRASNSGGSALAIPAGSKNKAAAFAFIKFALANPSSQVTMMKTAGLLPSSPAAAKDPYVNQKQAFWGDQAIWKTVLGTLPNVPAYRSTPYWSDAHNIMIVVMSDYMKGKYKTAQAALDDAAKKIAGATGVPIAQ